MMHLPASLHSEQHDLNTKSIDMPSDDVSVKPPILTSWKEIAAYFGKGVRTVQRWEVTLGLPVRRPQGSASRNIVMATRSDLDAWLQTQWKAAARDELRHPELIKRGVEEFQARLNTFQRLKEHNLQLQREVKDAVRGLIETCRALKDSRTSIPGHHLRLAALTNEAEASEHPVS
jgi:hypothetical protein